MSAHRLDESEGVAMLDAGALLLKGALEVDGGVELLTGFPAAPVTPFFAAASRAAPLLIDLGVRAQQAASEGLALSALHGAQAAGLRVMAVVGGGGLAAGAQTLAAAMRVGVRERGGGVVVIGDDPWGEVAGGCEDSRGLIETIGLPTLEPASMQELKDWVSQAMRIGQAAGVFAGLRVTTLLAQGGGTVWLRPNHRPAHEATRGMALGQARHLAPAARLARPWSQASADQDGAMSRRLEQARLAARELGVNAISYRPQRGERAPLGVIAVGVALAPLMQTLEEMGLVGRLPLLRLGLIHPLDTQLVGEMARQCDRVVVVEEGQPRITRAIDLHLEAMRQGRDQADAGRSAAGLVAERVQLASVEGVRRSGPLHPAAIALSLSPLVREHPTLPIQLTNGRLSEQISRLRDCAAVDIGLPARTPTFCSGCPHRDVATTMSRLRDDLADPDYMTRVHRRHPLDLVVHADGGCASLLANAPHEGLVQSFAGAGLAGGAAAAIQPFISNKQIAIMGDGAFFGAGRAAITQAIQHNADVTFLIVDNKTAASLDQSLHAGSGRDLMGHTAFAQDIERIVRAMAPVAMARDMQIARVDPADTRRFRALLEQTVMAQGVKIVIADKACGEITRREGDRLRFGQMVEHGFLARETHVSVATSVCENCQACTTQTGCPSLITVATDYGPKVQVDRSTCVNDGACHRIDACPSFEEVTVTRRRPAQRGEGIYSEVDVPDPPRPIHADQPVWRCTIAGVGGQGVGRMTQVLALAGERMGFGVHYARWRGPAVRTGGVAAQIVFATTTATRNGSRLQDAPCVSGMPQNATAMATWGQADLMLGVDSLEAARTLVTPLLRTASPQRTSGVINTPPAPTTLSQQGDDVLDASEIERRLNERLRPDQAFTFRFAELCERKLGSSRYANMVMLGVACQLGLIPLRLEVLRAAVKDVFHELDAQTNLKAIRLGRQIAAFPRRFARQIQAPSLSPERTLRRKLRMLPWLVGSRRRARRVGRAFTLVVRQAHRRIPALTDPQLRRDFIIRAFDCLTWGGVRYARLYAARLVRVAMLDSADRGYELTRTVLHQMAHVMLIKDEIYVAGLLTHPEKYLEDRRRFNVHRARGDRLTYRRLTRPQLELAGRRLRLTVSTRDWQLKLLARARWMRALWPRTRRSEIKFRDWYLNLLRQIDVGSDAEYQRWLALAALPQGVRGFREHRSPDMLHARRRAEQLLGMPAEAFTQPAAPRSSPRTPREVPLHVLQQA